MSTFLSLTVHCARCHDHKFDPIRQQDYYALQAVFAGVDRADRPYNIDPAVEKQRSELAAQKKETRTSKIAGDCARKPATAARPTRPSWIAT